MIYHPDEIAAHAELLYRPKKSPRKRKVNSLTRCSNAKKCQYKDCPHHAPHAKNASCNVRWCEWLIEKKAVMCCTCKDKDEIKKAVVCNKADECDNRDCLHHEPHILDRYCNIFKYCCPFEESKCVKA